MRIRPRRSVLYMPGSNARALEKAKTLPADCLILDLEDAVAPDAKTGARDQAVAAVKGGGYGSRELIIRINGLATPWGADDLKAAAGAGADAILIPKVQSEHDLEEARQALWRADAPSGLALWAMMETPLAILNAKTIAADAANARHPLTAFVMGTNDLAKETRAALGGDRLPMITWLSITIAAGRAFGVEIIDGVYNSIGDEAGLRAECAQGRALGMDGKTLIHPNQVGPCNEAFSPSADEVAWARKIIEAFALPENQGKGAISVEGRMVELLHAEMAKRTVAIADAIADAVAAK
jgi:citrate lyase subunit beta / citryl-CoA lyase